MPLSPAYRRFSAVPFLHLQHGTGGRGSGTALCHAFHHVFALWYFDKAGTVQRIHQGLKYENRPFYGFALGKLIGRIFLSPLDPRPRPDLIIPVPLHQKRLLERGYNQSEALAQGMTHTAAIPCNTRILYRPAYTQTQTGLDKASRLQNVARAFAVKRRRHIKNKHILLVDDVLTTGATLFAASQPLKQAGASAISIATFAMARP